MKKNISLLLLIVHLTINAQVSFGKENVEGENTILDFYSGSDNFRGLVIPAVTTYDFSTELKDQTNGIFLFDTTEKKIKVAEKNVWKSLSNEGSTLNLINIASNEESPLDNGVIIGSETSSARGVLILESNDKAMILPKIDQPHTNVKNPYPGMICYDTSSKSLAVYNGLEWSYW